MCSVSVGVEKLRWGKLGVMGKCVLNVDRYVEFVLWVWAKQHGWCISLVPRCRGGGGERVPGTHCLHMRLIATEFRVDRVCTCTYAYQ